MAYTSVNSLIDARFAHVNATTAVANFKTVLYAVQDQLETEATAGRISEIEATLFEDRILALASEIADSQRGLPAA